MIHLCVSIDLLYITQLRLEIQNNNLDFEMFESKIAKTDLTDCKKIIFLQTNLISERFRSIY